MSRALGLWMDGTVTVPRCDSTLQISHGDRKGMWERGWCVGTGLYEPRSTRCSPPPSASWKTLMQLKGSALHIVKCSDGGGEEEKKKSAALSMWAECVPANRKPGAEWLYNGSSGERKLQLFQGLVSLLPALLSEVVNTRPRGEGPHWFRRPPSWAHLTHRKINRFFLCATFNFFFFVSAIIQP